MWGFYFNELMRSLPFFLKGVWMTVAVAGLSLLAGTIIGFICWNHKGRQEQDSPSHHRRVGGSHSRNTLSGAGFYHLFYSASAGIELEAFPAAVIALSNLTASFICEIVASGILAVPKGQREAATAAGLSQYQQLRFIVLPQAMRTIMPPLVGQYVLLVKDSSVVSAIGVVDITRVGWLTVQRIPEGLMVFGLVGLLYFAICYPLINLSGFLERRMTVVSTKL